MRGSHLAVKISRLELLRHTNVTRDMSSLEHVKENAVCGVIGHKSHRFAVSAGLLFTSKLENLVSPFPISHQRLLTVAMILLSINYILTVIVTSTLIFILNPTL